MQGMLMDKTLLKNIILEQQERIPKIQLTRRCAVFDEACNYVLVGMRRAGKSYTLFEHIQQLIGQGRATPEEILYINFEDDRIAGITVDSLHTILDAYGELFTGKPRVFLDEVQVVAGWEKFARRLADNDYRVFITGSNARMLSSEIHSTLGGRFIARTIHPFTFREYLLYHDIVLDTNWQYSPLRLTVRRLFDDYFRFGGFAQAFPMQDKREWINGLVQKVLLGDIAARLDIRSPAGLTLLARKLAESVMQPTGQTRLTNILKTGGFNINRNTVADYLSYMEAAFLIFTVPNFSDSLASRSFNEKHYFSDNGLLNNYLFDPKAKLLENLTAIHLKNTLPGYALFYYRKNVEVDFFVPSESMAVQVSYSLADDATRNRETKALCKLAKAFSVEKLLIVTLDEEETIQQDGHTIQVVPIWKWLL